MSARCSPVWMPRRYQVPFTLALASRGLRRAYLAWHRRAGKDLTCVHFAAFQSQRRVGLYLHMLPLLKQGRQAIWNGMTKEGVRFLDSAFPKAMRASTNDAEMKIELANGSIFQLAGSDNYEGLLSTNPVQITFSEWATSDARAWQYLSPILRENEGTAIFISTPRGRNHFYTLGQQAKEDPENWFHQVLTVEHTGILSARDLDEARRELGDEGLFRQEYYCSFEAGDAATYYGGIVDKLEDGGKVASVPYDPSMLVDTAWDLGMDDCTAVWFIQRSPFDYRVIDYYEASGAGLDHYVGVLRDKNYAYGDHYLPHDAEVRELGTGRSRVETLRSLGLRPTVARRQSVEDGINAVRLILPKCAFDRERARVGLDKLRMYRRAYDEARGIFSPRPLHDHTSHAADAFRTYATAAPSGVRRDWRDAPTQAVTDYDPLSWRGNASPAAGHDPLDWQGG